MRSLTVLEAEGESIAGMIALRIRKLPEHSGARSLTFLDSASLSGGLCPDLLVVSCARAKCRASIPRGRCRMLLIPGTAADLATVFHSDCVVSYGMSKKDSITLSSIEDDTLILTLQRELPALTCRVLERQDIPIQGFPGEKADDVMACAASLLLLGAAPEELGI
jgi:hypothetical protein